MSDEIPTTAFEHTFDDITEAGRQAMTAFEAMAAERTRRLLPGWTPPAGVFTDDGDDR